MSNDLQADITTHLKGNGLTAATQGVDKLHGAIKRVHGSSHDLQSKADEVFGRFGTAIEGVEHRLHRVSRAIGRLGGESIAGPLHKLLAIGGLASGFGVLGLAVAGAGIAINLVTEHLEKNAEAAKEDAKAIEELAKAQEEARKAANEQALGQAKGQNKSLRQIAARGGSKEDVEKAKDIASNGANGMNLSEALQFVAKLLILPKELRDPARNAAIEAGRTGEIGPNEALDKIIESKKLRRILQPGPDGAQYATEAASRIIVDTKKERPNGNNIDAARTEIYQVDHAGKDVGDLGFGIAQGDKAIGDEGQRQVKALDDAFNGKAVGEAMASSLTKALGPAFENLIKEFKSLNENMRKQQEENEWLRKHRNKEYGIDVPAPVPGGAL